MWSVGSTPTIRAPLPEGRSYDRRTPRVAGSACVGPRLSFARACSGATASRRRLHLRTPGGWHRSLDARSRTGSREARAEAQPVGLVSREEWCGGALGPYQRSPRVRSHRSRARRFGRHAPVYGASLLTPGRKSLRQRRELLVHRRLIELFWIKAMRRPLLHFGVLLVIRVREQVEHVQVAHGPTAIFRRAGARSARATDGPFAPSTRSTTRSCSQSSPKS